MDKDDLKGLLEQQSVLALLDQILQGANELFTSVDQDESVKITVGLIATCAVSQLSQTPFARTKSFGTTALQALDGPAIGMAMKQAAAESRGRTLATQPLAADVWGLINNTLLARSIFLDFQAKAIPKKSGLLYAENTSKVLFQKLDSYIQRYASTSADELKAVGIDEIAKVVNPSISGSQQSEQPPTEVSGRPSWSQSQLAQQFRGRRLAELVLSHVDNQSPEQCKAALAGLRDELPAKLRQPVLDLIDFSLAMPQDQQASFFAGDCGERFLELMDVIKGYLFKNHQLQITQDDAFTIFNILVVNFALCCHAYPQTKAAMKKAAGVGFLGRLFGG